MKQKNQKDIQQSIRQSNQAIAKHIEESKLSNPQWYWHLGLHDAKILKVNEIEYDFDYTAPNPKINCLEIFLDSQSALFDKEVSVIRFYNYKLHGKILGKWWMRDSLEKDGDKYVLKLTTARVKDEIVSTIKFDFAEVERKYTAFELK